MAGFYGTSKWQRRRARQLKREPLCRFCAARGYTTQAKVADHVEPHKGDVKLFWEGELQSLCTNCHQSAKQGLEYSGKTVGYDIDGFPTGGGHW